jgi:hypothetical protein
VLDRTVMSLSLSCPLERWWHRLKSALPMALFRHVRQ